MPRGRALPAVASMLREFALSSRVRLIASGERINPVRQVTAMARGADAVYSARGFLLALGCIQALQCNANTCPVGLTTHDPRLTRGVHVDQKAARVRRYVEALTKEHIELLAALGCRRHADLRPEHVLTAAESVSSSLPLVNASSSLPGARAVALSSSDAHAFVPLTSLRRGTEGVRS